MSLSAADYNGIQQLHARYCHTIDFGDFDGIASCFAPDGQFEMASQPGHPANRRGTEAIRRSPTAKASKGHGRHTTISSMIDGNGDTGRSVSHLVFTRDFGPPVGKGSTTFSSMGGTGIYVDDLVKIGGKWVYSHRRYLGDGGPDIDALVGKPLAIAHVDVGPTRQEMTPLDFEAIRQLLVRCCHTLDFEDYDGFADCFADDGSFDEIVGRSEDPSSHVSLRGRGALRRHAVAAGELGYKGYLRHHPVSSLIEGDGMRARISSYGLVTICWKRSQPRYFESATVLTTGIYRDEAVKVEGRWLLSRRSFRKDTMPEVQALLGKPVAAAPFVA